MPLRPMRMEKSGNSLVVRVAVDLYCHLSSILIGLVPGWLREWRS